MFSKTPAFNAYKKKKLSHIFFETASLDEVK